jgi:hypothetical protein
MMCKLLRQLRLGLQGVNGFCKGRGITGSNANARICGLDQFCGLAFQSGDQRTAAGHEFKHLGWDHRFEQLRFAQQNKANL